MFTRTVNNPKIPVFPTILKSSCSLISVSSHTKTVPALAIYEGSNPLIFELVDFSPSIFGLTCNVPIIGGVCPILLPSTKWCLLATSLFCQGCIPDSSFLSCRFFRFPKYGWSVLLRSHKPVPCFGVQEVPNPKTGLSWYQLVQLVQLVQVGTRHIYTECTLTTYNRLRGR